MPIPKPRGRATRPAPKQGYHHADLRRALLDAAIAHLRDGEVTGLTMQTLARATGVSPGAPYHHFPDRVSVVAALATEGFAIWLERAREAVAGSATPRDRLAALAAAWLRFAVAHPSHYRVMFLPDVGDRKRFASLHATSGQALALLLEVVGDLLPSAALDERLVRAVAAWSTLHGFASLRIAGVLTNIPGLPSVTALESAAVQSVVAGVLRRAREVT